jgi:DHA2 family multidrug resistance protein-like MFS transporter
VTTTPSGHIDNCTDQSVKFYCVTPSPPSAPRAVELSPRRRWAGLFVLVLAVLLLAVDVTVLVLAVPALTADLGATATETLWIGDIYSLTIAGLLVVMGSVADRVGRKRLLLLGAAGFGAASLMAAFSTSAAMLIVARLLLGIAGATLMPSTLSLIRHMFQDRKERTRAIAVWSAAASAGAAVGPLVGGVLLEHFSWGSVFLINVPVMVVLLIGGSLLLPESRDPQPARLDALSVLLSIAAATPFVFAIKHTVSTGIDLASLASLAVGLAAGTLFVRRQRRLTAPLLDVSLFSRPAFRGSLFADFMAVFALTGLLFFFSQYLQLARGFSPIQAGLGELPTTLAAVSAVVAVSWLVSRLGRGRSIAFAMSLLTVGLILIAFTEGVANYTWLALSLIPVGLGVGLAQTMSTDTLVSSVPPQKAGSASAIAETAYELGAALGIAILGSVVSGIYRAGLVLPEGVAPADRQLVTESLATASATLDPASPLLDMARQAFTHAMQTTSLIAAVLTAIAAVAAWRTIPARLDHEPADEEVDARPTPTGLQRTRV